MKHMCHKCGKRPGEPFTTGSGLWLCCDCAIERINFLVHKGEDLQHKEDIQEGAAITTMRGFKGKGGKLS